MRKSMKSYLQIMLIIFMTMFGCSDDGGGSTTPEPPDGPQAIPGNLPADYDPTNFEIDFTDTWDYHSRWSPDGQYIAFTKYDHTECQNWLYEVSTGNLTPIVWDHGGDYYLSWSPNSRELVMDFHDNNGTSQIWVVNINSGSKTQITSSTSHVWGADWCRSTNKIILLLNNYITSMNPDGSDQERLVNTPMNAMFLAVSWDGSRIAFSENRNSNDDIYVIDRDGSNEIRVTTNPASDLRPRWSPDGTRLLYESDRTGNHDIYVYDFGTQAHTQLTNDPGYDSMSDWSPDGQAIVFSTEINESSNNSKIKVIPLSNN